MDRKWEPRSRDSILRTFGGTVRRLREAQGMSQEKLASVAGLDRTYVGGIERGERNLALLNLVRLAAALGVSPSDLMRDLPGYIGTSES